jgi:UDP-N-acetylglucosamine 4-epimerase
MSAYDQALARLAANPRRWLVTGAAGFIGSNLVEALLAAGQTVVGLDNFATSRSANKPAAANGDRCRFIEGDIRSLDACRAACRGVDYVLHQAAQVSVPASIDDPATTHDINVTGFLNVLAAAREQKIRRVVYASSCAIYGDSTQLPLTEDQPARPLSPYAASKLADEAYAGAFARVYGLEAVGLRYFNVFGPRQDPNGFYAAVIPLWTAAMLQNQPLQIFGDGSTTRDFCHVANVVQANVLAATTPLGEAPHEVINVAAGGRTSLNELFEMLRVELLPHCPHLKHCRPVHRDFRPGDIRHSQADITKAARLLGYSPGVSVAAGLRETLAWYRNTSP